MVTFTQIGTNMLDWYVLLYRPLYRADISSNIEFSWIFHGNGRVISWRNYFWLYGKRNDLGCERFQHIEDIDRGQFYGVYSVLCSEQGFHGCYQTDNEVLDERDHQYNDALES